MSKINSESKNKSEKDFRFRLDSIDVLSNQINQDYTTDQVKNSKGLTYLNTIQFEIFPEKELVSVLVEYNLYFNVDESKVSLINTQIKNNYKVIKINEFLFEFEKGKYKLLDSVALKLSQESLAQSRGIQAYLSRETTLDGLYLPYDDLKGFKQIVKEKQN